MSMIINDDVVAADLPVACSLGAGELATRSASLRNELFRHVLERQELPDGVRFRFPGSDAFRDKLQAFVVAERTCCAFFRIELAFEPGLGPIWLTLTGPAEVKEFVRQSFEGTPAGGSPLPKDHVPQLSRDELAGKIGRGDAVTLVEALPEPYYRKTHLPGAINIPAEQVPELAPMLLPDLDAEIIVYCANLTCPTSEVAARALLNLGYRQVSEYAAGKQDWIDAGLPIERGRSSASLS